MCERSNDRLEDGEPASEWSGTYQLVYTDKQPLATPAMEKQPRLPRTPHAKLIWQCRVVFGGLPFDGRAVLDWCKLALIAFIMSWHL
jgi:hypothetical protein